MPKKIKIRGGRLALDIDVGKDLTDTLGKSCEDFERRKIFSNEENYSIKFKKISQKDITLKEPSLKHLNLIRDYNKHFFKNMAMTSEDIGFSYLTLLFLKSPIFIKYLKKNEKRLKKDFFIYDFRDDYLITIDTKKRSGIVFYCDSGNKKNEVNSLRNCLSFLFFILLPLVDSFLLHCSALSVNGKGLLFVGEGGSGE